MSVARHHADWLSLVEVSGPFVSLPVLIQAFPQGLEPREPAQAKLLRVAYEEWQDCPTAPGKQRAWVLHVLTSLLGYPQNQITEGQTLPTGLEASIPEMGDTLRPDFALIGPEGTVTAGLAQLLVASYPAGQGLDKPVIGKHWKATPATRMMELLHTANVPLGLVTNGEQWMLVYAPRGETTGYASWYSTLWMDEPITLRAFHSLLGLRRFFGVAADSTLPALLKESVSDQQEVTDQLGYQVREAVEVLVQAFDALERETELACLSSIAPAVVYDAALTIMMRLVFLFSAEERDLLHLGEPLYDNNYAVSTLQAQLQEVADRYGEEVLERRYDAWARLLATFRAVHGGIQHQDLLMQAYGGSLFDPDRYPFLEGRNVGSSWRNTSAEPLAVNNRVVLHLLNSLQRLRTKVGGGSAESRRVSFRALGVEQIGHVYEGLLDHTVVCADGVTIGIRGTRSKEPEIALTTLEALMAQGVEKLLDHLKEATGRSLSALRKELHGGGLLDEHKLLLACNQDEVLVARLRPFVGLIREDSFERPWVVLPGSIFVTEGTTRRSTGTHYTPLSLTEPIVQHTLEPLVFIGPAEGLPKDKWTLKSPREILDLKVCDMAMGSGAFLVQACRYLADRLVEAWESEEKNHSDQVLVAPDGQFSEGAPNERLMPVEAAERIAIARRVVADRCLFGVDINPMAVEMAKLSMWLITVDAKRPFTFLDHAFKCGDSLLGITTLEQLEHFSLRPGGGKQQGFSTLNLRQHIEEAKKKRESLEAMPSDTPEQVAAKSALYAEAEEMVAKLQAAADVLLTVELKGLKGKAYEAEREVSSGHMMECWSRGLKELHDYARQRLGNRQCFHWALAFPEIMDSGGFHALLGNPPFIGGLKITGAMGTEYRDLLVAHLANGRKGSADLCAYFFLRAAGILRAEGMAGLLATNTIAQGDTREVGLDALVSAGVSIPRAVSSTPWPGVASLEVAHVWLCKRGWQGGFVLDNQPVSGITPLLTEPGRVDGTPYRLAANANKSFQGSNVLGMGFVLTPEEAAALISRDSNNRNCLFPYVNGENLNGRPDQSSSRWVINFSDWPLNRSGAGDWANADAKERKAWLRNGIVPGDYPDPVAADYPDLLAIVEEKVKPERDLLANGDATARDRARRWWQFARPTRNLYTAVATLEHVLATSLVNNHLGLSFCTAAQVFAHKLAVFPLDRIGAFALLQSSFHYKWAWEYSSTMRRDINYSPSDCFETFPFPESLAGLDAIGERYCKHRQATMQSHNEGLTKTYNRFHAPQETASEIVELRRLHVEMDNTVAIAYGWQDLDLGHGFHETKQGIRFTICESARREVLDRLLTLNHQRHAEEQVAAAAQAEAKPAKRSRKSKEIAGQTALNF